MNRCFSNRVERAKKLKKYFVLLFVFCSIKVFGVQLPTAKKGVLDLSSWDLNKNGKIEVRGEWKFFPNKIINPSKDNLDNLFKTKTTIKFPGVWNEIEDPRNPQKKLGPKGYGSFLLKVKGVPNKSKMGMAIKRFFSSYEVFAISGKSIQSMGGMGKVGMTKKSSVAKHGTWKNHFISPSNGKDSFYILINSSNYRHRGGGLRDGMFLGLEEDIGSLIRNEETIQFFLIGIFIIMGLYHLTLFNQRHEDYVSLYFSIFLISLGARLFFNNSYLDNFIENSGNLQFLFNRRLEFITVFCAIPAIIGYTQNLFPSHMPKGLLKINLLSSLLATIFIILTEPITFSIVLPLMWVQCTFSILITIYVAIRETFKKTEYSMAFLLSFITILIGGIQSILVTQHILPPPEFFPITCTIFVFIQSSVLSKKFSIAYRTAERLSQNLFDEVRVQTKEAVDQKNRALASEKEVSNLLDNMKQSVFSVNKEGIIIPPVSKFSHELFGESIEGLNVFNTLFKDYDQREEFISGFKFALNVCVGADDFQFQLMGDQLPKKINLTKENDHVLSLKIIYAPILDDSNQITKIMLVVEDVSELEKKEKEAKEQEAKSLIKVKRLQEIVSNGKKDLSTFIGEMNYHMGEIKKALKDKDLNAFFRPLHTLKGGSRAYGLSGLSSEIHLLENKVIPFQKDQSVTKEALEVLKKVNDTLGTEIEGYISLIKEVYGEDVSGKEMNGGEDFIKLPKNRFEEVMANLTEKLTLNKEFELLERIKGLKNEEFKEALMSFKKVVDKISISLDKKIQLSVDGDEVFLGFKELSVLKDSILHIIQNACDHGIEKEGEISIDIKNENKNENISIKVTDTGKGMDPDIILEKAIEKGVVSRKESLGLKKNEKLALVMEAGFSTKKITTEYSGRGVGMDVVKKNIESLGGFVILDSELNKGTTITLNIPPLVFHKNRVA